MAMPLIAYFYNNNEFRESIHNNKNNELKKTDAKLKKRQKKEIENKNKEKDKKENDEVKEINKRDEAMRDIIATFNHFI